MCYSVDAQVPFLVAGILQQFTNGIPAYLLCQGRETAMIVIG